MKGSLIILSFFSVGVLLGYAHLLPEFLIRDNFTEYALYLLMFAGAQPGLPYITHYKLPGSMSPQTWSIEQGSNNLVYFLNRKGVFSFDGYEWENIKVDGRPLAMAFHADVEAYR